MIGDFADFVSRLRLTPAGVVRSVAADPKKAAENLAKSAPTSRLPPEPDQRKKITPEQALREAMFDGHQLAELLTGQESPWNSEVWRTAANKPLSYSYVHKMFDTRWCEYWARRILARLILLVVATATLLFWRRIRAHAHRQAAGMAREVFPVWAAQGPFESGAESAAAMRYAYMAVKGPDEVERMAEAIDNHASAYDSDPTGWERTREEVTQTPGVRTERFVTIAKGVAATAAQRAD